VENTTSALGWIYCAVPILLTAMPISDHPQGLDPTLARGISLFNHGDYYACHDVLEAIWMEAPIAEKPFYQGILQIAVGLYHLGNHNWRGAMTLLGEGVNRLRPFEPVYKGVDIIRLVDCGWAWLTALNTTGPEQVSGLAQAMAQAQVNPPTLENAQSRTDVILTVQGEAVTLPVLFAFPGEESNA
jgi:predicted metal-dependent hydrolase